MSRRYILGDLPAPARHRLTDPVLMAQRPSQDGSAPVVDCRNPAFRHVSEEFLEVGSRNPDGQSVVDLACDRRHAHGH